MVAFAALTLGGSVATGLILARFFPLSENPVSDSLGGMTAPEVVARLIPPFPS